MAGTILELPSTEATGNRGNPHIQAHRENMRRLLDGDVEERESATPSEVAAPVKAAREQTSPARAQFTPTRIKLREGRIAIYLDVLFFSVNEFGGILIGIDPRGTHEIDFAFNEHYHFEYQEQSYPRSLYTGSFRPTTDGNCQFLSFLQAPAKTQEP